MIGKVDTVSEKQYQKKIERVRLDCGVACRESTNTELSDGFFVMSFCRNSDLAMRNTRLVPYVSV